jgi:hypothetical protein
VTAKAKERKHAKGTASQSLQFSARTSGILNPRRPPSDASHHLTSVLSGWSGFALPQSSQTLAPKLPTTPTDLTNPPYLQDDLHVVRDHLHLLHHLPDLQHTSRTSHQELLSSRIRSCKYSPPPYSSAPHPGLPTHRQQDRHRHRQQLHRGSR